MAKKEETMIESLCSIFLNAVVPKDASNIQKQEMKTAFYAGFMEALLVMGDISSTLPEEEAVLALQRVGMEGRRFLKNLNSNKL